MNLKWFLLVNTAVITGTHLEPSNITSWQLSWCFRWRSLSEFLDQNRSQTFQRFKNTEIECFSSPICPFGSGQDYFWLGESSQGYSYVFSWNNNHLHSNKSISRTLQQLVQAAKVGSELALVQAAPSCFPKRAHSQPRAWLFSQACVEPVTKSIKYLIGQKAIFNISKAWSRKRWLFTVSDQSTSTNCMNAKITNHHYTTSIIFICCSPVYGNRVINLGQLKKVLNYRVEVLKYTSLSARNLHDSFALIKSWWRRN